MLRTCLDDLLGTRSRYWLARQTGISEGNLRRLGRGETTSIKFENLEKICRALGCKPGDMLVLVDTGPAMQRNVQLRKSLRGKKGGKPGSRPLK